MPVYVMTSEQYEERSKSGFLGLQREGQFIEPEVTPSKVSNLIVAANVLNNMRPKVILERLTEKPEEPDPNLRLIVNEREVAGKMMVTEIYSGQLQPDGGINITTVTDTLKNMTRTDKPGMVVYPEREDPQQMLDRLQERRRQIEYPPVPPTRTQPYEIGTPYQTTSVPSRVQSDLPMGTPIGNNPGSKTRNQ